MRKLILALVVMVAMMIGTSMAVEQITIDMPSCPGEGFYFGLLDCSYEDGWRVQETWIESGGLNFYLDETGLLQYLGEPITTPQKIKYIKYWTYLDGPQGITRWQDHLLTINMLPCSENSTACDFVPLRDTRIEIEVPTEVGQEIDLSIRFPGNGQFASIVYLDGVESTDRVWNGESCIVVEALVNGAVYARDGITV